MPEFRDHSSTRNHKICRSETRSLGKSCISRVSEPKIQYFQCTDNWPSTTLSFRSLETGCTYLTACCEGYTAEPAWCAAYTTSARKANKEQLIYNHHLVQVLFRLSSVEQRKPTKPIQTNTDHTNRPHQPIFSRCRSMHARRL